MKFSLFYHSLVSDWNHGNAHFLRGVVSELIARGHQVSVFEPADGWSRENLLRDHGPEPLTDFQRHYPALQSSLYSRDTLDLDRVVAESDVVLVHEWNEPWLVNGLAKRRRNAPGGCHLLFHDTHHRVVSDPDWLRRFDLEPYDGVLAFGEVLSETYRSYGWNRQVWTWHEAADTRIFYPHPENPRHPRGDLVWIGNWGDDERSRQLHDFLFHPVQALALTCHLYGVRYPAKVLSELAARGIRYRGWLANFHVPAVFANHRVTVHIPRQYYRRRLPGIPTIRPFEAMACGIPLISAPWDDAERLFTPGKDYLVAHSSAQMQRKLRALLHDRAYARQLAEHALSTIRKRHTCVQRVDELLEIIAELGLTTSASASTAWETNGRQRHVGL